MAASTSASSPSAKLRDKGNQVFRSITDGLSPCLRRARLNQAKDMYLQAAECSQNCDEHVSAIKNCGIVSRRLSKDASCPAEELDHLVEALHFYNRCLELGPDSGKDDQWINGCYDSALTLCADLTSHVDEMDDIPIIMGTLNRASTVLSDSSSMLKSTWLLQHAQYLFNWYIQESQGLQSSSTQPDSDDYRTWARLIAEAMRPAQEAMQGGYAPEDVLSDARVLLRDLEMAQSTMESVKMREQADAMLEHEMFVEVVPRMDVVWVAVDHYREAAKLTRELDLENEAIALSRLGRVYDKVVKDKRRSELCYKQVLKLGEALKPRNVFDEAWYQEALEVVQRFQEEAWQKDQKAADERRAPFLQELADDLAKLKAEANRSSVAFLKHVYVAHPPRNEAHKLEEEPTSENAKALLRKAVVHYHPDKQHSSRDDERWCVLCEEITKFINNFYEMLKG